MGADHRQRRGRRPADRQRNRLDMPLFARRDAVRQHLGSRRCLPRLAHSRLELQKPGPRDMSEREIRIDGNRAFEQRVGADIRRQQQIDRGDIIGDGRCG
jgi:hypothetical protein